MHPVQLALLAFALAAAAFALWRIRTAPARQAQEAERLKEREHRGRHRMAAIESIIARVRAPTASTLEQADILTAIDHTMLSYAELRILYELADGKAKLSAGLAGRIEALGATPVASAAEV